EEDLSQAELLMREHWEPSTVYQQGTRLLGMIHFLAARSICRPLYYVLQATRVGDFYRHTLAGQEERSAKLPSLKALEGVADIYSTYATRPADRLCSCALALLVVTGFRLGELLTLPLGCEVTEIAGGKERYGIRYYKEKARGAEKMLDIRWLTPTGAALARKAIAEIQELTSPARERESWSKTQTVCPFPDISGLITYVQMNWPPSSASKIEKAWSLFQKRNCHAIERLVVLSTVRMKWKPTFSRNALRISGRLTGEMERFKCFQKRSLSLTFEAFIAALWQTLCWWSHCLTIT
ncbi:MAG TPA: hypothetical protein VH593_01180, partial [Ktedonobacteraceae bacterium]